jgi:hypothetical protein
MRRVGKGLLATVGPILLAGAGLAHPAGLSATTADRWVHLHIVLLPIFPLLAVGFVVLLRGRPRAGLDGVATIVAWVGAGIYAVGYTGLDAVAGIAAGTVAGQDGDPAELRRLVLALYDVADRLGRVGVYGFLLAVLAGTLALAARHGTRVFAGSVLLLGAGYSFIDSHIFWPRGVLTMLAMAAGFALWTWAATRDARTDRPATSSASPEHQAA